MKMPACDITLYAVYIPCDDTIYSVETFTMNIYGEYELTEVVTNIGISDSEVEYIPPEREGFTINTENSVLNGAIFADGSLVLKVFYDRNMYDVTFDDSFNTISEEYYYGDEIPEPETPCREGYVFDGWVDGDGNYVAFPYVMPAEEICITAVFSICEYTVHYNLDGGYFSDGEQEREEIYEYGSEVYFSEYPVKEGYTFAGWINDETGEEVIIPLIMPACDITLRAEWVVNQYRISFDDGFGNIVAEYYAEYGSDISFAVYEIPDLAREGYTFAGWWNEAEGGFFESGMTMPASDLVFRGYWEVNCYTATWIVDGESIKDAEYYFDETFIHPEVPEKTGYTFDGWVGPDGLIYAAGSDYIMPAENITFTACYIPETDTPYTVIVYEMDSVGCYPVDPSYTQIFVGETDCQAVVNLDNYVKEGFSLDLGKSITEGIIQPDGSLILEIYLERNTYELSLDTDDNIETILYYYGSIPGRISMRFLCYF